MVKSMTGYGKAEALLPEGKITIEIRTLNGKNADIGIKTSLLPKDKEMQVRSRLASALVRGTIDLFMTWEPNAAEGAKRLNSPLIEGYYKQLCEIRATLPGAGVQPDPTAEAFLLASILRIPDVVDARNKTDVIDDTNWEAVSEAIDKAVAQVDAFRSQEGAVLYKDVTSRISNILALYDIVEEHEQERLDTVRTRLRKNLEELATKCDPLRFEQEMVYYLERYDINEEKVRLRQHCKYFMDTIDSEPYPGKKLGFIIQEIGREINTTGSKANNTPIQQAVVRMKDELEKMREQSMNIL